MKYLKLACACITGMVAWTLSGAASSTAIQRAVEAQKMRDYETMQRVIENHDEVMRRYCVCAAPKPDARGGK